MNPIHHIAGRVAALALAAGCTAAVAQTPPPYGQPMGLEQAKKAMAAAEAEAAARRAAAAPTLLPPEEGGPAGPEPTRYGDWEIGGRAVDF